jgi:hypothetical protein
MIAYDILAITISILSLLLSVLSLLFFREVKLYYSNKMEARIKAIEDKPDRYDKYRNADGLLTVKNVKEVVKKK